jgi:hypothetical protein
VAAFRRVFDWDPADLAEKLSVSLLARREAPMKKRLVDRCDKIYHAVDKSLNANRVSN